MKPRRPNKWLTAFVIQGRYPGLGWEDATEETTRREALARLREYAQEEPEYPHRLIRRRERNYAEIRNLELLLPLAPQSKRAELEAELARLRG